MQTPSLIVSLLFASISLAACGGNPVKVAKERDRADERRGAAEAENKKLDEQNQQLETALKNAVSTTHFIWTFAAATGDQEIAAGICEEFDFSLPTTVEIAEFKTEVYDKHAFWQKIDFERFFKKDVVWTQTDVLGFVLCRRELTTDIINP